MLLDRISWLAAGALALIVIVVSAVTTHAQPIDPTVREQLTPTGKLRVGVAAGLTPGTGNVAIDPASGRPRGIGADLGAALARVLGVEVVWVTYLNSGDLTDAGNYGSVGCRIHAGRRSAQAKARLRCGTYRPAEHLDGRAGLADPDTRRRGQARHEGRRRREHGIIACGATII